MAALGRWRRLMVPMIRACAFIAHHRGPGQGVDGLAAAQAHSAACLVRARRIFMRGHNRLDAG